MLVANADLIPGRQAGRLIPKSRPKALRLGEYLDPASVPNLPASTDRRASATTVIKRMFLNDSLGDCVIADYGHELGIMTGAATGVAVAATDAEIKKIYRYFSPWDNGCSITQVLDYAQTTGLMLGGKLRKIGGYVAVNPARADLLRAGIYLFGGIKFGLELTRDWYQSDDGATWDVDNSRTVGGHDVFGCDYDENGVYICTWGGLRLVTWAALASGRFDEAYVPLSPDWSADGKLAASGVDMAELASDLQKIGGGSIPPISPPAFEPFVWA